MQLNAFSLTMKPKNKTYTAENGPQFGTAARDRVREQLIPLRALFLPREQPLDIFMQFGEPEPDMGDRQNATEFSESDSEDEALPHPPVPFQSMHTGWMTHHLRPSSFSSLCEDP